MPHSDFDADFAPILDRCQPFTMTSPERLYALFKAIEYICSAKLDGDIVECGVWKGGSMMCAALSLLRAGDTGRRLHLYDTFEGMVAPDANDVDIEGRSAETQLSTESRSEESGIWAYSPLEAVRRNMATTGYPEDRIHYIRGAVEDTIPAETPGQIAVLRLDTDWYSSTRHELEHLFPLLIPGGVLIIDDYGHWQGARRAVDEYFARGRTQILLNRIDYTGRLGIKLQ